jgi:hypothetical protein
MLKVLKRGQRIAEGGGSEGGGSEHFLTPRVAHLPLQCQENDSLIACKFSLSTHCNSTFEDKTPKNVDFTALLVTLLRVFWSVGEFTCVEPIKLEPGQCLVLYLEIAGV